MSLFRLAWSDVTRSAFRSWTVFLCAMLVAGLALATVLITQGAQESLRLARGRLGADIIVVPEGTETKVESALLMGTPTKAWMPATNVERVRKVTGVVAASPQLYLASLKDSPCCSVSNMLMVAFDPRSDFTVQPWIAKRLGGTGLGLGDAVGGTYVYTPAGMQNIKLYDYLVTLRANLAPTGTNLDRSMFITFQTAQDMARLSKANAKEPLALPADSVSAVLVKVAPGRDPKKVAVDIFKNVPGVTPVVSPQMFGSFRGQMNSVLNGMVVTLGMSLVLSLVLIALVFTMATHERRREIGVFRALGATRGVVWRSLVLEAVIITTAGAAVGVVLASAVVLLFRDAIVRGVGFPFIFPSPLVLLVYVLGGLLTVLAGVALAVSIPAVRTSLQDPAAAMRE